MASFSLHSPMCVVLFIASVVNAYPGSPASFEEANRIYDLNKAPPPAPPAGIGFNFSFGSTMVLQQKPAKACLFGTLGAGGTAASIKIAGTDVNEQGIESYEIQAQVDYFAAVGDGGLWNACLRPTAAGGTYTITATCTGCTNSTPAVLTEVTFGDVWYCGGQSNMALPLAHTLSRNISRDAILKGSYSNIRIHGLQGNMNPEQPWSTLKNALSTNNDSDMSKFGGFSSTCYYFGESLSDEMEKQPGGAYPIGLVHTAWGGSTIEQWLDNATIATCANASMSAANQEWHDTRVLPYIGMTVKGFLWYQGENDMHNYFGNSAMHTGYSCLMPALVKQWRSLWSATPGTTDPDAPFGIVTLPATGSEGGASVGTMRWAQTAGYGTTPNEALPNVFVAQGYDLVDAWSNDSCYGKFHCHDNSVPPPGGWGDGCDGYCASVRTTNWYMGPIHGRDKKPVGMRLAQSAQVIAYGNKGWSAGPQISGCSKMGNKITVSFNATMMGSEAINIQPYYEGNAPPPPKGPNKYLTVGSMMEVLTSASNFCMQQGGPKNMTCRDDGTGHRSDASDAYWIPVNITTGSSSNEVVLDLSSVNGSAFAIRYAWIGDCCSMRPATSDPCPLESCPIMGSMSKLPANPFVAHLVNNKCKCIAPQVCDE